MTGTWRWFWSKPKGFSSPPVETQQGKWWYCTSGYFGIKRPRSSSKLVRLLLKNGECSWPVPITSVQRTNLDSTLMEKGAYREHFLLTPAKLNTTTDTVSGTVGAAHSLPAGGRVSPRRIVPSSNKYLPRENKQAKNPQPLCLLLRMKMTPEFAKKSCL